MSGVRPVKGECTFCYARSSGTEVNTFPVCGDPGCALSAELHTPCELCGCALDLAAHDYHDTKRVGIVCCDCYDAFCGGIEAA